MATNSIFATICILLCSVVSACSQPPEATDKLLGDWIGESKCVGKNSYCHDEIVVCHITRIKNEPKKVHLVADKIVDGKAEFMGEFDFDFDPEKQTLTAEFTIPRTGGKGVWLFKVDGDKMNGTLTIFPENEVGRRITVEHKKPDPK